MLNRRRFLSISASAACLAGRARANTYRQWTGTGLGARMTITLDHPDGDRIARMAFAEIERLEDIFSLYRSNSVLARLNRDGALQNPPFEFLECLSLSDTVHRATGGLFDPTVQPLWRLHAERVAEGRRPTQDEIAEALKNVGFDRIGISSETVRLPRGAALTLNGVAQGYVADCVASLLARQGMTDILIDAGELVALGGPWPVAIDGHRGGSPVSLRDRALATSAPLGTVLDAEGRIGHILDPRTGEASDPIWRSVTVTSASATLADALSTAVVLMEKPDMDALFAKSPADLVLAIPFHSAEDRR